MGDDGFILKEGKFRLDVRKNFFTQIVVRHWNRFPKLMDALFLETLKTSSDGALCNQMYRVANLAWQGGWN